MVRYAFRRLLWMVPSVLGVSLLSFFLLSFLPSPAPPVGVTPERWRERFVELPLFFNLDPHDVRALASREVQRLVEAPSGSPEAAAAANQLVRLGGAALPVILPSLDALPPSERIRVALALARIADRMGLDHGGDVRDPEQVVVFWNRFWETRGVEFSPATARSAVRRYARYGTEARAEQLRVLDTYALPYLIEHLSMPVSDAMMPELSRLTHVLQAMTGRGEAVGEEASLPRARAVIYGWQRWWLDHQHDYQRLVGAARISGFVLQSRYGKWVYETVVLRMGRDEAGRSVLGELIDRMSVTLSLLVAGLGLGYLAAVLIAALGAWFRGRWVDRVTTAMVLLPYALSPALVGVVLLRWGEPLESPMAWGIVTLAAVVVADPMRQGRAALVGVLTSDYVQAARARGAGPVRLVVVHGLRNALAPVATRLSTELPVAVTACFVIERVYGLEGMGAATLAAVATHDVRWLMAVALGGAALAVLAVVISDVAYASLDPRVRIALTRIRRRKR